MAGTVGGRRAAPFKIRDGRGNNAGPRRGSRQSVRSVGSAVPVPFALLQRRALFYYFPLGGLSKAYDLQSSSRSCVRTGLCANKIVAYLKAELGWLRPQKKRNT
ncbi:hypothetical protein GWI33_008960, partial [Rhynchophorus ferrugineus]